MKTVIRTCYWLCLVGMMAVPAAAQDTCATATPVAVPSSTAGTTVGATIDTVAACGTAGIPTAAGVWFTVTGTGNSMTASLCNVGTTYDTQISVFSGSCVTQTCVDGNDNFCGLQSEVSWCSTLGTNYMILVHGAAAATGAFTLDVSDNNCASLDGVCTLGVCNAVSGVCEAQAANEGGACDDGNACTTADSCISGICTGGAPPNCVDGNVCTTDSCDTVLGCQNVPNTAPCDDANACTTGDTCSAGACVGGAPPNCNDLNVCTDDSCDTVLGCQNVNNTLPCDDGDICTTVDACSGGACVGSAPLDCSDLNVCTTDSCDALLGCQNVQNTAACDDGNACTTADTCSAGVCVGGAPPDCNDLNLCTNDSCDTVLGCQNVANTLPCDDGDLCTTGDVCGAGLCTGTPLNCSSLTDVCNIGTCNVSTGVCVASPTNEGGACTDGNVCTFGDACLFGSCLGTPDPLCTPTLGLVAVAGGLPVADCYALGDTITVEITMGATLPLMVGGQFFLEYDTSALSFISIVPGDAPFTFEVFRVVDQINGTIDYAVGVPSGDPGTNAQTVMARATFEAVAECDSFIRYRQNNPSTVLTDSTGTARQPVLSNVPPLTINGSAPVMTCPSSRVVNADAGEATALVTWPLITAQDSCDGNVVVTCTSSPEPGLGDGGGVFPPGVTTISCVADHACGVTSSCTFDVDVTPFNEVFVDVELSPTIVPTLNRCITFDLWRCGAVQQSVSQEIDFGGLFSFPGRADNVSVLVPAGAWECMTARDPLHTLRATAPALTTNGTTFSASFIGPPSQGGSWLTGGNLNGDFFVDILDFAVWNGNFGVSFGNTNCAVAPPHADINGDGIISAIDFTFIQQNFLQESQPNCCGEIGVASAAEAGDGPLAEISVRRLYEMGLGDLASADVNGDGMVDVQDMALVAQGRRTTGKPQRPRSANPDRRDNSGKQKRPAR